MVDVSTVEILTNTNTISCTLNLARDMKHATVNSTYQMQDLIHPQLKSRGQKISDLPLQWMLSALWLALINMHHNFTLNTVAAVGKKTTSLTSTQIKHDEHEKRRQTKLACVSLS